MKTSILTAFYDAIKTKISDLYVSDGLSITWDGYGEVYPQEGQISGAIAVTFREVDTTVSHLGSPRDSTYLLRAQVEVRLTKTNGFAGITAIYDHHEFLLDYLIGDLRVNGINGTYQTVALHEGCLGLSINSQKVGIAQYQDDLVYLRSLIEFDWEYRK